MKDLICREMTEEDFPEIVKWYENRKWRVAPNPNILPGTAYVGEVGGKLISVIWLYITNSGIGIIDWVATNPDEPRKGIISLKNLLRYTEEIAGTNLSTFIHFTHNDKLAKYFNKKCGFKDNGTVNMSTRVFRKGE